MIFTIKDLLERLNAVSAEHGDQCLIGIDDADTNWELPLEEFRFDPETKRVFLKADYHGEDWPTDGHKGETMSALEQFMIGKVAIPDHPATPCNPNGRDGFIIAEIKRDGERLFFRGKDTLWFGEGCITRFADKLGVKE